MNDSHRRSEKYTVFRSEAEIDRKKFSFWASFLFYLIIFFFVCNFNFYHFHVRLKAIFSNFVSIKTFYAYYTTLFVPVGVFNYRFLSDFWRTKSIDRTSIKKFNCILILFFVLFFSHFIIYSYRKPSQIEVYFIRLNFVYWKQKKQRNPNPSSYTKFVDFHLYQIFFNLNFMGFRQLHSHLFPKIS